jgi:hypothetical protein
MHHQEEIAGLKTKEKELSDLRGWVTRLMNVLSRNTSETEDYGNDLDLYFAEWVKRQELKRRSESNSN